MDIKKKKTKDIRIKGRGKDGYKYESKDIFKDKVKREGWI